MKNNIFKTICLLILLVSAAAIGFFFGSYNAQQDPTVLLHQHFEGPASNLKVHIRLLEKLRTDHDQEAINALENLVDIDLISLSAYRDIKNIQASKEVIDSIQKAKIYREKYPKKHSDQNVSSAIEKAFKLVN